MTRILICWLVVCPGLALTAFGQLDVPTSVTRRMNMLKKQARYYLSRQQPDSAWQYGLREAMTLLPKLSPQDSAYQIIYGLMGNYHYKQRKFAKAIEFYTMSVRKSQATRDTAMLLKYNGGLEMVYANLGMCQQSIQRGLISLRYVNEAKNPFRKATVCSLLADNYIELRDSARADYFLNQAVSAARRVRQENPIWAIMEAEQMTLRRDYLAAIRKYREFIQLQTRRNDRENVTYAQLQIAECYQQAGQLESARQTVEAAIQSARFDRELTAEAEGYLLLSQIRQAQKQPDAALEAARQSARLTWETGHIIMRPKALKQLAAAEEQVGNYQAAMTTHHQLEQLTDSLNTANKAEVIAATQATFDVEQKDNQITLLNKNLTIKDLENQQQRLLGWSIISTLLLGVGLTIFFLRRSERQKRKIARQATQLADLNGLKDRLFAIISHDLRGPVLALNRSVDYMAQPTAPLGLDWTKRTQQARHQATQITHLTDNLLHWSLNQMNGMKAMKQEVYLPDVFATLRLLFDGLVPEKNVQLLVGSELLNETCPPIWANEQHVQIVLRNIIQNALKFSPTGGLIHCMGMVTNNLLTISITDDGPGFDWQAHRTGAQVSTTGTGLGLRVVENLMQQNSGQLQILARADHPGTLVKLSWPTR